MTVMTDSTGVDEFLGDFAAAWSRNDGAALGEFFAVEGTLINPFGQRAEGRAGVAAMYTEFFGPGQLLHATTTTITVDNLRQVHDGSVFLDSTQRVYGANGDIALVVHLAALLCRVDGHWQFLDARPYATLNADAERA